MFAKNLETLLFRLSQKGDVSHVLPKEFAERFDSLRRYGRLPRGRAKCAQVLTLSEIASAILGLVSPNPKWAGHGTAVLERLCPVGGVHASFCDSVTLQEAIAKVLSDAEALKSFVNLAVTGAESGINSHGLAVLTYETAGSRRRAAFVRAEAVSQLQPGAEQRFDFDRLYAPMSRQISFNRGFMQEIAAEIEYAKKRPVPAGDGSEYDAEEIEKQRYEKLEVRPNSRFLNIGVDNQVTWPSEETLVKFDKYKLVLMPKTREKIQSVHLDLTANRLSDREALTIINRFLSVMAWCSDSFAIAQGGWSGNPIPVPVDRRDLAFVTAHLWAFDRGIPASEDARRALALYREARNAQQNFMVSYAVLNFYKIIELRHHGRAAVIKWFRDNYAAVSGQRHSRETFIRFESICGRERPHEYIHKSCRIAVAHSGKHSKSDPDDSDEITRLHTAAEPLHLLARYFIKEELRVSDLQYANDI